MRSKADIEAVIDRYADMVYRICLCHLKNPADSEDLFQNIFLKYMTSDKEFACEEHKKAWLIRVASNACKDYLRTGFWKRREPLDSLYQEAAALDENSREVLQAVIDLPEKYKDVIYLFYYEGYSAREIADILGKKENTIYSLLSRGRQLLKMQLGGIFYE